MFITLSRRNTSLDQPAASADRVAREGRGRRSSPREPVPSRSPRGADAAYRRQPAGPRRRTHAHDRRRRPHRGVGAAGGERRRAGLPARPGRLDEPSADQRRRLGRHRPPADRAGRQRARVLRADDDRPRQLDDRRRGRRRRGRGRRARHPRECARRDQRDAAPRRRRHPRHRAPDGPVRGEPARPAARRHRVARAQRKRGNHRVCPAAERDSRGRAASDRRRCPHRRCRPRSWSRSGSAPRPRRRSSRRSTTGSAPRPACRVASRVRRLRRRHRHRHPLSATSRRTRRSRQPPPQRRLRLRLCHRCRPGPTTPAAETRDEPLPTRPTREAVDGQPGSRPDPLPDRKFEPLSSPLSSPLPTAASYAAAAQAPPPASSAADQRTERPTFPPLQDSEAEADTPIFRAVRSAWLSANATMESWRYSEIEAGWAEADRVEATEAPVNDAGLPTRRPGTPPRSRRRRQAGDGRRPRSRGHSVAARRTRSGGVPRPCGGHHRP